MITMNWVRSAVRGSIFPCQTNLLVASWPSCSHEGHPPPHGSRQLTLEKKEVKRRPQQNDRNRMISNSFFVPRNHARASSSWQEETTVLNRNPKAKKKNFKVGYAAYCTKVSYKTPKECRTHNLRTGSPMRGCSQKPNTVPERNGGGFFFEGPSKVSDAV